MRAFLALCLTSMLILPAAAQLQPGQGQVTGSYGVWTNFTSLSVASRPVCGTFTVDRDPSGEMRSFSIKFYGGDTI